jgi:hypothetical protein
MRKALRRGLFFSLLLALTIPLVSCDSGGSNGSSPSWSGEWEVTSLNGTVAPADDAFVDLSTESFVLIDPTSTGCDITTNDVLSRDGNTLTLDIEEGTEEITLDVSDGTLTGTVLETDDPDSSSGDEFKAKSVDDARAEAGC